MDNYKNPAVIGCVIVVVVVVCIAIYFFRCNQALQERVTNLENVSATSIKELGEFREQKKAIPWAVKSVQEHAVIINKLNEQNTALVNEVKTLKKTLAATIAALKDANVVDVKIPKAKKSPKKKKSKKSTVSFDDEDSEESQSDSSDSSDSDDDATEIKKALDKMKKKKKKN